MKYTKYNMNKTKDTQGWNKHIYRKSTAWPVVVSLLVMTDCKVSCIPLSLSALWTRSYRVISISVLDN